MAFLKSKAGRGSCRKVCHYLLYDKGEYRACAVELFELSDALTWWEQMDETRKMYGKFQAGEKTGKPRDYYHFIISPDESDDASIEQVRTLAGEWVNKNFEGYEVAIVVHDDNRARIADGAEGIVHAHVIVNSVHPITEKKIHIDKKDVDLLTDSLQELCPRFGLTPFAFDESRSYKKRNRGKQAQVPRFRTTAEKEILKREAYSWKEELRVVVERTVPFCTDFVSLQRHLAPYGFGVRHVGGELLFINPEGKKIRDSYLGLDFKKNNLARFFTEMSFVNLNERNYPSLKRELEVKGKYVSRRDPEVKELQDTLDVLSIIEREGIQGLSQFEASRREIREFGKDMRTELYKLRAEVSNAQETLLAAQVVLSDFADENKTSSIAKLKESGYDPQDASDIVKELSSKAERLLTMQAEVEGCAQRISDLTKAGWLANRVLSDSIMYENEERVAKGMLPYVPPPTKITAPPKAYNSKNPPYWLLNISKKQYQKLAETNRKTRAVLSKNAALGERRLPPYIQKHEQIERSMNVQARMRQSTEQMREVEKRTAKHRSNKSF